MRFLVSDRFLMELSVEAMQHIQVIRMELQLKEQQ